MGEPPGQGECWAFEKSRCGAGLREAPGIVDASEANEVLVGEERAGAGVVRVAQSGTADVVGTRNQEQFIEREAKDGGGAVWIQKGVARMTVAVRAGEGAERRGAMRKLVMATNHGQMLP